MSSSTLNPLDDATRSLLKHARRHLASEPALWQSDLLDCEGLYRLANAHSLRLAPSDSIHSLWRLGLLRADLVQSTTDLRIAGLVATTHAPEEYSFSDERPVPFKPESYGSALATAPAFTEAVTPFFHPFRLFVLHHVVRVFECRSSPTQYLAYAEGVSRVSQLEVDQLNRWSSEDQCPQRFDYWNEVAELAAVLEPLAYERIFHSVRYRFPLTESTLPQSLSRLKAVVTPLLVALGNSGVRAVRQDLGHTSEMVDANSSLKVLLRLMSAHERQKLRGALGLSMIMLTMAEVLRRLFEDVLSRHLPEEDQIGLGQWMDGARKAIYGTDRVFDASRTVLRDYLTSMGLDHGVKARCYVEGETEYGALTSALGDTGGIEIINLRGQVVERRNKGLTFADSLVRDIKSTIFSIVVIDQDRQEYVRAVQRAASEKRFFGSFFLNDPDFEFCNFTVDELITTATEMETQSVGQVEMSEEAVSRLRVATSNGAFFQCLRELGFIRAQKNSTWGVLLMKRALSHPTLPEGHSRSGQTRPIVEVANLLRHALISGYTRSGHVSSVNPLTGKLERR
jgi:hypothetical protein